jgi:hypothetical protein
MKILRTISVFSGAAILLLAASAPQASAGEFYGWGSCPGCGGNSGYGYSDRGSYGYGSYGSGRWDMNAAVGSTYWSSSEYSRYVVGHGPMYPAENYPGPRYSYMTPATPDTSATPSLP